MGSTPTSGTIFFNNLQLPGVKDASWRERSDDRKLTNLLLQDLHRSPQSFLCGIEHGPIATTAITNTNLQVNCRITSPYPERQAPFDARQATRVTKTPV